MFGSPTPPPHPAQDGIANLKRVIELMIAKCNQQTSRMGVLEAEIKMKKDLAVCPSCF
jgi:hypothetical protein